MSAAGKGRGGLRWISEHQVAALVDINDAMDALRIMLVDEALGQAGTVDKALGTWPGGAMHALGSMCPAQGYAGFKTWVHTDQGATAIFSLFDMTNGRLCAVLEAATLGQLRTSAVSGLAASVLAHGDAHDMALIGTGAQALTQVAAVAAVRPLRSLRVFSPTAANRDAFIARASEAFDFPVINCGTPDEAMADAGIVTLITRANSPFIHADSLAKGTLVIAAGAIIPANAECFPDVLQRSTQIVVDSIGNARKNSRELIDHLGQAGQGWAQVRTLGEVLRDSQQPDPKGDLCFFKPMGTGLADLSVAIMAYERATKDGIGLQIDQPRRAIPRWRVAGNAA